MTILRTLSLLAATVTMGLMAGLFTAFAYSVMPGLLRADARTLVLAMQRINEAILNGWFFACFFGALLFTGAAAALHASADWTAVLPWIVAALVLYLVALVVTMAVNVPLNNALAQAGDPDRLADVAAVRDRFAPAWIRWNLLRAVASVAGFALLSWALVVHGRIAG
ncbi:anthrone oxygenase family protein [Micromonospora avicenniae]|uniref:anthrone oxygenase family protein n=1 Tax=Micromonospora avicenniae TaxID=1198245 RepID=UPI00341833DE